MAASDINDGDNSHRVRKRRAKYPKRGAWVNDVQQISSGLQSERRLWAEMAGKGSR